jgi:hypothetical protein
VIDQRRLRLTLSAVAAAACLVGCGQQHGDRPDPPKRLTTEQAQALAVLRFNNFSAGRVPLTIEAHGAVTLRARVVVDFRAGAAYGDYTTSEPDSADPLTRGVIAWSSEQVGTASGSTDGAVPAATAWTQRALDASQPVDVALALALQLGADRPENPALLQQSGARLLRVEGQGDKTVYVMSGPGRATAERGAGGAASSRTTYWVDRTGHLERLEAQIGSGDPATFTVDDAEPATIPAKVLRFLRRAS